MIRNNTNKNRKHKFKHNKAISSHAKILHGAIAALFGSGLPLTGAEKRPSLAMRLRRYCNCTVVRTPRGTPRWAKTFSDRAASRPECAACGRVAPGCRSRFAPRAHQDAFFGHVLAVKTFKDFQYLFGSIFCSIFPSKLGPLNRPKSIKNR